jgi:endonuclease G, mitochondrial
MSGELLRVALAEHAAAQERPYFDEKADAAAAEQYYAGIEPTYDALHELLESTHREQPHYSPAVELYPWVDLRPDGKIRSLYTEEEYEPEQLIEEAASIHEVREALRAENKDEAAVEDMAPYNCEHTVCQSWFEHDEPMRGDLHHLFACERKCNSFRGNTPYTEFADYDQVVREACGKSETAGFEPWRGKGPAARATLYFTLRYPKLGVYSEDTAAIILAWHEAEPVDEFERHRNAAIFERQGNRNPLIDRPEWGSRIAFSSGI